jgi:DnaK suppressor protein
MTEKERTELIHSIKNEIDKLQQKIEELKEFTAPVAPDNAIGRVSRMDAINNKSIYDASMRNSQNRLHQLKQVLSIAGEPDFGTCVQCHQPIAIERLKIRPEIRRCAKCLSR